MLFRSIDAETDIIRDWYMERFRRFRLTAFQNPQSFFHRYAIMTEEEAMAVAADLWNNINLKNLQENILPTRPRADLILRKGSTHRVEYVALRKL